MKIIHTEKNLHEKAQNQRNRTLQYSSTVASQGTRPSWKRTLKGGKIHLHTYISMYKTLTSVLDQAFGKSQFGLTVALATQHHSGFCAIFHATLSNHNTARKLKKTKQQQQKKPNHKTPQHLSYTEPILFFLVKVAYAFIHHQVHELFIREGRPRVPLLPGTESNEIRSDPESVSRKVLPHPLTFLLW